MTDNRDYIVSTFKDGDTLVEYEVCHVIAAADLLNNMVYLTVTMPVLQTIEKVVEIHVTNNTSPAQTAYGVTAVRVSGVVVGFTLASVAATGTICTNVCVVGF